MKLHLIKEGYLEAELAGDYAWFPKLTGEKSEIMVVAGVPNQTVRGLVLRF